MSWRDRLEQLIGLLEKVPQPRSFSSQAGVYRPYFLIELRASNWEIIPYAAYTRLDGVPGREIRLSLAVLDSSKVSISQSELDALIFLESDSATNSRAIFNYPQPVGFLLEWLSHSTLMVKEAAHRNPVPVTVHPQTARIILRLSRANHGYTLEPTLVFSDGLTRSITGPVVVLTSNPIFILYDHTLYKIHSELPAVFWNNYFRTRETFEIPPSELNDFVRIYLPHLLPVLDWQNLGDHISRESPPLTEKRIYFDESHQHLQIEVRFCYGKYEFHAHPVLEQSLAGDQGSLVIVTRDVEQENRYRRFLEENGLIFRSGHWLIAAEYHHLDWMREVVPILQQAGFKIIGEEKLRRYRVHRERPKLMIRARTGMDWLDLQYHVTIGRTPVEVPDFLKQLQQGKRYIRLADGSNMYIPDDLWENVQHFNRILDMKSGGGETRLPLAGLAVLQALENVVDGIKVDAQTRELLEKYRSFERIRPVPPPKGLQGQLRSYQQHGLDWLNFLHEFRFGGILADDMGLGKTVQVIALLLHLKEQGQLSHPALIVVPLTLIFNWWEEFQKFAPHMKILRYHGNRSERSRLAKTFSEYDVILCSYGVVLQDQRTLGQQRFEYIILDESQKIKNPQTKTYKALSKLSAPHKLALTGTPVENSLTDLWAQINFVNPGLLGTLKQFQQRYLEVPEEEQQERIDSLKRVIYPFILRRTKGEVEKELPPLTEIVQYVEMTEDQKRTYRQWLEHYRDEVLNTVAEQGIHKTRLKIIEALTYLRQIACHPAILDQEIDLWESGKVQLLIDMLEDLLGKGHKILIFSQFVRFLRLIRRVFDEKGWHYEYLDGRVRDRGRRIHNFQENPNISAFLISLKAGGLGLNLTAADYVIHLDPWWNPAVEQQATDRAHRIGQDKRVFVYKYIVKDSVEEKILLLQQRKKQLSQELITSDSGFVKQLTREDLEILFNIHSNGK